MMTLIVYNATANPISYLGGTFTVASLSSTTATATQLYPLCRQSALINDCLNGNVLVNDGTVSYYTTDAVDYLGDIASSLGGAVVGYAGSAAPSFQITCGGKDSNGNSQAARMNQFADLSINFRNSYSNLTGNATTTVKSGGGTLHSIMINNNTTGGTVKVYDNTAGSGTLIATFLIGSPSGGLLSTSGQPGPVFMGPMGLEFTTGLTVVTSNSSSNNITVVYQ